VAILGNFVNRALVLTEKYFGGRVPELTDMTAFDKSNIREIGKIKKAVEGSLENYRFREALKNAMDLARLGNKYLADTEPWILIKTDEERVKTILNVSLQITAALSTIIRPFLPDTADKISRFLNTEPFHWEDIGDTELLKDGHKLNKSSLLFEKIDDDVIEKQLEKLAVAKTNNNDMNIDVRPSKSPVTFDAFSKMDIRVGTVLEAQKVPKANKLLQLKIDTGVDVRDVVSGIAEYFETEQIVGKQVAILVNLEPRTIRGIESRGMILMAEDSSGKLTFILPEEHTENGSEIK
jgi:methionyl-tRNA synthetase